MASNERHTYTWDGPGTPVVEDIATVERVELTMEELLEDAPVGSTVVWKDAGAAAENPFATVPTVKLGPDEFAVHGVDPDRNVLGRAELVAAIRRRTGTAGASHEPVFVAQIEVLERS